MMHQTAADATAAASRDRRETPRVQALDNLHGHIVTVNIPMRIRELGLGGFSIESPMPFPAGAIHDFRLSLRNLEPVTVRGRVAYCRRHGESCDAPVFVVGFALADDSTGRESAALGSIIDAMTASLSFESA